MSEFDASALAELQRQLLLPRAAAEARDGDYVAAERTLAFLLQLGPSAAVHRLQGLVAAQQGNYEAAREHLGSALQLDPADEAARAALSRLERESAAVPFRTLRVWQVATSIGAAATVLLALGLAGAIFYRGNEGEAGAAARDASAERMFFEASLRSVQEAQSKGLATLEERHAALARDVLAAVDRSQVAEAKVARISSERLAADEVASRMREFAELSETIDRLVGDVPRTLEPVGEPGERLARLEVEVVSRYQDALLRRSVAGGTVGSRVELTTTVSSRYEVRPGDTLTTVSERVCGDASLWNQLAAANPGKIGKNGSIAAGARLKIPC